MIENLHVESAQRTLTIHDAIGALAGDRTGFLGAGSGKGRRVTCLMSRALTRRGEFAVAPSRGTAEPLPEGVEPMVVLG